MRHRVSKAVAGALLLALIVAPAAVAQGDDLAAEIQALKAGQAQIRNELQEIKELLQARPAPAAAAAARPSGPAVEGKVFDLANNPVKGIQAAQLTLIEFLDYQ